MESIVALDPAGPFAQPLSDLSWLLFVVMFAVLAVVIGFVLLALFAGRTVRRWVGSRWLVVAAGLVFPAIVVSALFIWSIGITDKVMARSEPGDLRIRVTGEMWWWRVHYLEGDRILFETANEIRIPIGQTVAFELGSQDVIHAFWIPQLGGKMDLIPGRTNLLRIQADRAGIYRGQCVEYCGSAHALMAMEVVAQSPADFDAWAARQAQPTAGAGSGWDLFAQSGCGACHTVRGTEANGLLGPDLTHVAARRTLAAGILPNDPGTLRSFVRHPGALKPGIRMPDYDRLSEADIDAISTWLETLK
jgi:cytochrome c oxidase subunit 2